MKDMTEELRRHVLNNNINLELGDWDWIITGIDSKIYASFGGIIEYKGKKYLVRVGFPAEEMEAHENDYGDLDWDNGGVWAVEER